MAEVLHAAEGQVSGKTADTFSMLNRAFEKGKAIGLVGDRLVRSSLSCCPSSIVLPNPFPSPHNLDWYLGRFAGPQELRQFATLVGKSHTKVWSVAKTMSGYDVLVQVLNSEDPPATVTLEMGVACKRLTGYRAEEPKKFTFEEEALKAFMSDYAKQALDDHGLGDFVVVSVNKV
jgi:hypothetical protein